MTDSNSQAINDVAGAKELAQAISQSSKWATTSNPWPVAAALEKIKNAAHHKASQPSTSNNSSPPNPTSAETSA